MNATTKNTTLPLPISPGYVQSWGFWEAIREFVQNGMDGQDKGWPLSIERGRGKGRAIKVRNEGADLTRDTLLLGTSSKRGDDSQRGQFGEGYKLAALVLCRMGFSVQIRTQNEMWDFEIAHSGEFGADTLRVKIRPAPRQDFIEVRIEPMHVDGDDTAWDKLWEVVMERVINVNSLPSTKLAADEQIAVPYVGTILTSERHRGKLFSRGLYVGALPDGDYAFGYDLNVELDRDRRMADPWSLRYNIARTFDVGLASERIEASVIKRIFAERSAEARSICEFPNTVTSVAKLLSQDFVATHGADAVPVTSYAETEAFNHINLKPVVVDRGLRTLLEATLGSNEQRAQSRKNEVREIVQPGDITAACMTNLLWACGLVQRAMEVEFGLDFSVLDATTVVRFWSTNVLGLYECNTQAIRVAESILSDRAKLVATIAHETAHHIERTRGGAHGDLTETLLGRALAQAFEQA
jgi:hypothetical protein